MISGLRGMCEVCFIRSVHSSPNRTPVIASEHVQLAVAMLRAFTCLQAPSQGSTYKVENHFHSLELNDHGLQYPHL